jgi:hypothetical protein
MGALTVGTQNVIRAWRVLANANQIAAAAITRARIIFGETPRADRAGGSTGGGPGELTMLPSYAR